jgi:hypothetical protein
MCEAVFDRQQQALHAVAAICWLLTSIACGVL